MIVGITDVRRILLHLQQVIRRRAALSVQPLRTAAMTTGSFRPQVAATMVLFICFLLDGDFQLGTTGIAGQSVSISADKMTSRRLFLSYGRQGVLVRCKKPFAGTMVVIIIVSMAMHAVKHDRREIDWYHTNVKSLSDQPEPSMATGTERNARMTVQLCKRALSAVDFVLLALCSPAYLLTLCRQYHSPVTVHDAMSKQSPMATTRILAK